MPYAHLYTDKELLSYQVRAARDAIAAVLEATLGKDPTRCMIQVDTRQPIALCDDKPGCAFLEIRVNGTVSDDTIPLLGTAMKETLSKGLKIDPERIYVNLLQMAEGGMRGDVL